MKVLFSVLILFYTTNTLGQSKTYQSKLTEYFITDNNAVVPTEWIIREITVNESNIRILTKDSLTTEIQTWTIYNKTINCETSLTNTVYYTYLTRSENEFEHPSVFTVRENRIGKVEFIDWQIPNPPDGNKSKTYFYRFHID